MRDFGWKKEVEFILCDPLFCPIVKFIKHDRITYLSYRPLDCDKTMWVPFSFRFFFFSCSFVFFNILEAPLHTRNRSPDQKLVKHRNLDQIEPNSWHMDRLCEICLLFLAIVIGTHPLLGVYKTYPFLPSHKINGTRPNSGYHDFRKILIRTGLTCFVRGQTHLLLSVYQSLFYFKWFMVFIKL